MVGTFRTRGWRLRLWRAGLTTACLLPFAGLVWALWPTRVDPDWRLTVGCAVLLCAEAVVFAFVAAGGERGTAVLLLVGLVVLPFLLWGERASVSVLRKAHSPTALVPATMTQCKKQKAYDENGSSDYVTCLYSWSAAGHPMHKWMNATRVYREPHQTHVRIRVADGTPVSRLHQLGDRVGSWDTIVILGFLVLIDVALSTSIAVAAFVNAISEPAPAARRVSLGKAPQDAPPRDRSAS